MAQVGQYVGLDISEFRRIVASRFRKAEKEAFQAKKKSVEKNLRLLFRFLEKNITYRGACQSFDLYFRKVNKSVLIEGRRTKFVNTVAVIVQAPMRHGGSASDHAVHRRDSHALRAIRPDIPVHRLDNDSTLSWSDRSFRCCTKSPRADAGRGCRKAAMPLEKVRKVMKIRKEPIFLETPIGR